MNGWDAENEASQLLRGLGIGEGMHYQTMSELAEQEKVKSYLHKHYSVNLTSYY